MADDSKSEEKKTLSLSGKLKLGARPGEAGQIRQSFSHGRSKTVAVEVRRRRPLERGSLEETALKSGAAPGSAAAGSAASGELTASEWESRLKAVQGALQGGEADALERERQRWAEQEAQRLRDEADAKARAEEEQRKLEEEQAKAKEQPKEKTAAPQAEPAAKSEAPSKVEAAVQPAVKADSPATTGYTPPRVFMTEVVIPKASSRPAPTPAPAVKPAQPEAAAAPAPRRPEGQAVRAFDDLEDESGVKKAPAGRSTARKAGAELQKKMNKNQLHRLTFADVVSGEDEDRPLGGPRTYRRKMSRGRDKAKRAQNIAESMKIVREVIIPEVISVQELSNRMAVRGADLIKKLMSMGMMVTINQEIDGDTAEMLAADYGHQVKRVASSDVETALQVDEDDPEMLHPRAPVVTVMGHVDHGKTSLLDAIRRTDVVSGEAGGITQHIGAYQVTLKSGQKISFIDTPGHAAFTEMRARGANVTDIVVLVVAADDGIMEQTVEAIHHAKAAGVPIIVAINKIDKPNANPDRVRNELLQHELVLEELGGDILAVEVSAKTGLNIDKLEEAILLQAEILDLKANPNRSAQGVVIEAKMDKGRGPVATVLVQRGTLQIGDIFVAGAQWGRVRALVDDKAHQLKSASPAMPVEVLGLSGAPVPGDDFAVVDSEAKAREVAEYRQRRDREQQAAAKKRTSMEDLLAQHASGIKELPMIVKTDVQGSLEAIVASLAKMGTNEVVARVLHSGVGAITESDVILAKASGGCIMGFNVRANAQARELAAREGVEIRYYAIIYDLLDDVKAILGGLLAPTLREQFLGNVEIREVFNITKVGKIAGCYVTEGVVKRGAKVRLLRDNVVIHEGTLKTLRRFKDEVKEAREGFECGIAFENYQDIRVGDIVECFDIESIARTLE